MKSWKLISTLLLVSVILCAMLTVGSAQGIASPQDMLSAYRQVMLGEQNYFQTDPYEGTVTEATMTPDISQWFGYIFEVPLRFVAFAVTDLDKDGSPELLLKLSEDFGFELLRFSGGAVYGYPFVARAMEAVTADGEIHASNGASDFGWYTLNFSGSAMETAVVCWTSDAETEGSLYTIGGAEVSESDFTALNDAIWNKAMIEWTDYTLEALDAAIAGV